MGALKLEGGVAAKAADNKRVGTPNGEFAMTEGDFKAIARMLYEDAGIFLAETKATFVYSRLSKRLRVHGLNTFADYCELVGNKNNTEERMAMLAALTTNVTHFFRENHHFEHLKSTFLPPLLDAAKRGGRLRIWSAGCSIGHEPYSIAMTILSMLPDAGRYDVRILASDIDPNVVATGRAGVYGESALSSIPTEMRRKFFRSAGPGRNRDGEGEFEVVEAMRSIVAFRELNLNGSWPMKGQFDAIFCRNVTIRRRGRRSGSASARSFVRAVICMWVIPSACPDRPFRR